MSGPGPEPGSRGRDEVAILADRLYLVVIHLLRRMRREDDSLGLSASQLSAITRLVSSGPLTLTELARAEGVKPPTMTRLVQRLEDEGLVLRKPSAADGRVSLILHSSRGLGALEAGRRQRVAAFGEQLGRLPERDLDALARAIDVLELLSKDGPTD